MSNSNIEEIHLKDPLSQVTRNERRNLLGASAIGIVIVKTGLIPSKISALGIEFTQTDRRSLLLAIAAIVGYFLLAFLVYASSDLLAWRVSFQKALLDSLLSPSQDTDISEDELRKRMKTIGPNLRSFWFEMAKPISFVRAIFEFVVPILIGGYAIYMLIRTPV